MLQKKNIEKTRATQFFVFVCVSVKGLKYKLNNRKKERKSQCFHVCNVCGGIAKIPN